MSRKTIAAAVVLGLALTSTSPRAEEERVQAEPIRGDGTKVRVLDNPYGTLSWARFAIQKLALDQKYGLSLELVPYANTPIGVTIMQANGADLGLFGWNDIGRMRNAGLNVVGIAPMLKWADYVVVPPSSTIRTLADLKGKTVGTTARSSLNWIVMRAVAHKVYGFDLEKQATVQEGAVSLLRGLLEQEKLDATVMFNDFTPALVTTGKARVLSEIRGLVAELGLPDAPFLLVAASADYAAAHPTNLRAYLAAYRDAMENLKTDEMAWREHGAELKMTDNPVALAALREDMRAALVSTFSPTTEQDIRKTFDVLLETAGEAVLGMKQLPDGFMTLAYQ